MRSIPSLAAISMCAAGALLGANAYAQATPQGLWQSVGDSSGKPRAQVRLSLADGAITGRIERTLQAVAPGVIQRCTLCADDRKDQPMIGMEIIRRARASADPAVWEGGEILDPDKGKTFKLRLQLQDGGKQLQVRGYIGPFFRNQTWIRLS